MSDKRIDTAADWLAHYYEIEGIKVTYNQLHLMGYLTDKEDLELSQALEIPSLIMYEKYEGAVE